MANEYEDACVIRKKCPATLKRARRLEAAEDAAIFSKFLSLEQKIRVCRLFLFHFG
jgi:hypothetical protein